MIKVSSIFVVVVAPLYDLFMSFFFSLSSAPINLLSTRR